MDVWNVSIWYVLLAAVVYFAIGSVYYSPIGLVKPWSKALGRKVGDMGPDFSTALIVSFLLTLVLVLVEAYLIHATGTFGFMRGAYLGAKIWLGFVATTALINSMYEGGNKKLYAIDMGYHLIGLVVAGGILAHFIK